MTVKWGGRGLGHSGRRSSVARPLGAQLVSNGDFASDITGWGNHAALPPTSIAWSAGRLRITNTGGTRGLCGQTGSIAVTAGQKYDYSIDVEVISGGGSVISINLSAYATGRHVIADNPPPGIYTFGGTFDCAVSENVHFNMDFAADAVSRDCYFDNISLRQVL